MRFLHVFNELCVCFNRLPEWTEKILKPGGDFGHLAAYWFKFVSETTKLKRLKSGFLLKEILNRFRNKSLSTLKPDRSLYLYSGHDTTVATMLNTLGLFDVIIAILNDKYSNLDKPINILFSLFLGSNAALFIEYPIRIVQIK